MRKPVCMLAFGMFALLCPSILAGTRYEVVSVIDGQTAVVKGGGRTYVITARNNCQFQEGIVREGDLREGRNDGYFGNCAILTTVDAEGRSGGFIGSHPGMDSNPLRAIADFQAAKEKRQRDEEDRKVRDFEKFMEGATPEQFMEAVRNSRDPVLMKRYAHLVNATYTKTPEQQFAEEQLARKRANLAGHAPAAPPASATETATLPMAFAEFFFGVPIGTPAEEIISKLGSPSTRHAEGETLEVWTYNYSPVLGFTLENGRVVEAAMIRR